SAGNYRPARHYSPPSDCHESAGVTQCAWTPTPVRGHAGRSIGVAGDSQAAGLPSRGQRANHRAPRKRPLPAWPGGAAEVHSRHITDLRHAHVCFIPILATKIRDMSSHDHAIGWPHVGQHFRMTWAIPAATRSNGAATVGSATCPWPFHRRLPGTVKTRL